MVEKLDEACPIWGTMADVWQWDYGGRQVKSERAGGTYRVRSGVVDRVQTLAPREKAKLTTWIVDQHRLGVATPVITADIIADVLIRRRLTFRQRVDRFFQMLSRMEFGTSGVIRISGQADDQTRFWHARIDAWTESASDRDAPAFLGLLKQDDLLIEDPNRRLRLTPKGADRLDATGLGGADTRQAFVAMWFDDSMNEAYLQGIAPAIRDAGYEPLRIDQKEHANKVDDEIIAEIRRSRFIVADFTSAVAQIDGRQVAIARGGVYYEAGFAQGLNIPVIWTVNAACIDFVHFDTRQYSHIVWNEPSDLRTKLYNRIAALLGEAPNAPGRGVS